MKNILFFRISLALVGLLCSGGQAKNIFPISDEVNDIPYRTVLDTLYPMPKSPILFDMYAQLHEMKNQLFELIDTLTPPDINTVKRTSRNANTDRTELPENIDVTIKSNDVTESHTQPNNMNYLMISHKTPIIGRLIYNNTKQNNDTYVNKFYNLLCILSTWPDYLTIRTNSNQIPRLVYIISEHTWNIYFMIKNTLSEQYNKIVKKLYTVYNTLQPRSFIASIAFSLRKYWLLKEVSTDTITENVALNFSLYIIVVFCGMLLFVAFIVARKLWNSRRKLKPQQEDFCVV